MSIFSYIKMKLGYYRRFVIHKRNIFREKNYRKNARQKLKNRDFTIIANNCWGGSVYEDLDISYNTPTVGLFFFAPCYIKFLTALRENLLAPLHFIHESKYEKGNHLHSNSQYPIGLINGEIEVHFMHYHSEAEALEKWTRRAARVNYDNLFVSFTDNEICSPEEIQMFDSITAKKVFFSSTKMDGIKSLILLPAAMGETGVGNLYDNRWKYRRRFNVVNWLNSKY